jgi:hypothetical protein
MRAVSPPPVAPLPAAHWQKDQPSCPHPAAPFFSAARSPTRPECKRIRYPRPNGPTPMPGTPSRCHARAECISARVLLPTHSPSRPTLSPPCDVPFQLRTAARHELGAKGGNTNRYLLLVSVFCWWLTPGASLQRAAAREASAQECERAGKGREGES